MYILGISAFYHDAAAALLRDGEIVAAAQEERFTRRKGDPSFPRLAIDFCLSRAGIEIGDVDEVVYYEKPWLKFERLIETYASVSPRGLRSFLVSMPIWIREKLLLGRHLSEALGYDRRVLYCEHHESHMAAAFLASPFERAAILTVDGVGEWATATWGWGEGKDLHVGGELHFPHSLGLLYAAFTAYLGFRVNDGEYKVMGLAPYGEPRFAGAIREELVETRDDGSFRLNMEYFDFAHSLRMTNDAFDALLGGPPRAPDDPIDPRHLDVARSIQEVTEEILLAMACHAQRETGMRDLVLGGGVALNCVANGRILRETPFERLWIQPAAGDAGSAIGCALAVWHGYLGRERRVDGDGDRMAGAYLGPSFDDGEIRAVLDGVGARYRTVAEDEAPAEVARRIAAGEVVGVFDGPMEFGPRALGNRSILADARSPTIRSRINDKIKLRESFRPLAPAVPLDRADRYFDLEGPSPYMLVVAPVRAERLRALSEEERRVRGLGRLAVPRSDIPAVTHVDGSARIQTVDGLHNGRFLRILRALEAETGCAVVVNTSFNVRGEPIVCTPEDALRCFLATEMDSLLLGNHLLERDGQPRLPPRPPPATTTGGERRAPTRRDHRLFGIVLAVALSALALFGAWREAFDLSALRIALLSLAGVLLALALAAPAVLATPRRLWMALGERLAQGMSTVLLSTCWVFLLAPFGLLRRLLGRDPLWLRPRPEQRSFWRQRPADTRGRERYEQPF